jgi:hypothetical protein
MKNLKKSLIACLALCGASCATTEYPSSTGVMGGGAALGAGLGALVGSKSGSTVGGAAVGAGTGAVIGSLVSGDKQARERELSANEEVLRRQQVELDRQLRELEHLKRQQYYDGNLRRYEAPSDKLTGSQEGSNSRRKVFDGSQGGVITPAGK